MQKPVFHKFLLFPIFQVDNSGQYSPQFGNDGPGPIPYVHVGIPPIPYIPDTQGQYYGPSAPPYLDGESRLNSISILFCSRI